MTPHDTARAIVDKFEACWPEVLRNPGMKKGQGCHGSLVRLIAAALEAERENVPEYWKQRVLDEREACAKVCDERAVMYRASDDSRQLPAAIEAECCAAAIRKGGT